jgi:hypothetical protein
MTIVVSGDSIKMEDRSRWSLGLEDRQTTQPQAITGTPCEVPVPKKLIFSGGQGLMPPFLFFWQKRG